MAWLLALVLGVAVAVSTVVDRPASATAPPGTAPRFRVATFNIHKGADREGRYDLDRTVRALAGFDADLIGVQEAMRNDPGFNCDDQPALIAQGLSRLTGHRWHYVYAEAWITRDRTCQHRRAGDTVATEGLAIFARSRMAGVATLRLSAGRIGLSARPAAQPELGVLVTHLSANRQNQPERVGELGALLPWAERRRAVILMGDLNAEPDAPELGPVHERYRDAWRDAAERALTRGIESGATRPGRRGARIDYVFYAPGAGLRLESVDVVDTASAGSPEVSDHRPVVATFRHDRRR